MDLAPLLHTALHCATIARDTIMPLYRDGFAVETKADRTPVTEADKSAEEHIRNFLAREHPTHGVIGEEHGETPGDGRHRWVLDPIDGTKSFVHRVPLFGTLIALEIDSQPVIGVIACHAAGETVYAAKGHGAFLQRPTGDPTPARVSPLTSLEDAMVSTTSYTALAKHHRPAFENLLASRALLRTWGDCYGYLLVATGRAEAMLDPVMNPWDIAALYPIITEAGGRITTWDGSPGPGSSAVATNAHLHPQVLALLNPSTGPGTGD